MIEEAAGTSLYEKKREHTAQTIERKDVKIKEIQTVKIFKQIYIIKFLFLFFFI